MPIPQSLPAKGYIEFKIGPGFQRESILASYDLVVTLPSGAILEVARFSHAALRRVIALPHAKDGCILRVGAFCEFARAALIMIGGEHHNENLFNYTFSGVVPLFRPFMNAEAWELATTVPSRPVEIGHNVVVSERAVILGGACVGQGSVIAAGAVVTGRLDELSICGGIPARTLRPRFGNSHEIELYKRMRMPDIRAHHLPLLPSLAEQLQNGLLSVESYSSKISFLDARPAVHMQANVNPDGTLVLAGINGFSLNGERVTETTSVAALSEYFHQAFQSQDKIRWTPDIFHTLGLA